MTVYNNPIVLQRADPWVLKVDGEYWFTASDPEYDDQRPAEGPGDRGLAQA